jgi:uncharacterized membrane protein YraQ (UPF0718 family)
MYYLYSVTAVALLISFIMDRQKTLTAVKISYKRFTNIIPAFLTMLISVSIVLFFIPDKMILDYLGNNDKFIGVILASFLGSIALIPGFIVFPLCGILLKKGVSYMVLSAFTTTLMMVGVLTYPLEREYFGVKVTIVRNIISFFIAFIVALSIGFFFGELL